MLHNFQNVAASFDWNTKVLIHHPNYFCVVFFQNMPHSIFPKIQFEMGLVRDKSRANILRMFPLGSCHSVSIKGAKHCPAVALSPLHNIRLFCFWLI